MYSVIEKTKIALKKEVCSF